MSFVCLMYHEIASPYKHKFYVTPENFRMQMEYIVSNGYKIVNLNESLDGDVLITFDDGHKSNLDAARILAKLGISAVFYLVKDFSLNNKDYLNEEDIKEISSLGHVIGVHGKYHDWWTTKSKDQLISELDETARWIERITGRKVITCSAPGGRIKDKEYQTIKQSLPYFKYIRNSVCSFSSEKDKMIHSMPVTITTTMNEFKKIMDKDCFYYKKSLFIYNFKELAKNIIYKIKGIE